jgi:putative endonuclease
VLAALVLMLKGYRILGFRLKTPVAEIDLLALRGQTLAVVEVKRLLRAGAAIQRQRPSLSGASVRLDLIALAPGRLPMHIPDAWKGG